MLVLAGYCTFDEVRSKLSFCVFLGGNLKAIFKLLLVAVCSLGVSGLAHGDSYSLANSVGGDGYVVGDIPVFQLFGANNNIGYNFTTFTTTVSAAETVKFIWRYSTADWSASYDPAGYLLNGTPHVLATGSGTSASGVSSIDLNAGDTFGWYVYTTDGGFGRGKLDVEVTPEPGSLLLFGSGLAGLIGMVRRRRSA